MVGNMALAGLLNSLSDRVALLERDNKILVANNDFFVEQYAQLVKQVDAIKEVALYVAQEADHTDLAEKIEEAFRVSSPQEASHVSSTTVDTATATGGDGSTNQRSTESGATDQSDVDGHHGKQSPAESKTAAD